MANLQATRTLFAFTSPRTIEKIIPEIDLLHRNFNGRKWNQESQCKFFEDLFNSDFYEGHNKPKDMSFAARDRITRAPKALGFIDLKPTINLTEQGEQLIKYPNWVSETITKQLLKFQLPSPYHKTPTLFFVKPYLELLRLIKKSESLSKIEIALFFTQLTHFNKFDEIVQMIRTFRLNMLIFKGNRKTYIEQCFKEQILKIYQDDIENLNIKTRESANISLQKFIKTKQNNLIDYADAFLRYIRATQLVTFNKSFRAIISPSKIEDVEFILSNISKKPIVFESETLFKQYLFSKDSLKLLTDQRDLIIQKLSKFNVQSSKQDSLEKLKSILEEHEKKIKQNIILETTKSLKGYKELNDIIDIFQKISTRDVPDPPLYLEWNVWRALVMLNYAQEITGNFTVDLDGIPLCTARGNIPDIELEYDDFKMIVEVTISTGNKQYEMEGEPVPRHFGNVQLKSEKPVYCLFIAPKISEGTLAHFFNLNKMNTRRYGGKTRIIPFTQKQFVEFIKIAQNKNFNNSKQLQNYFEHLLSENFKAEDEVAWFQCIENSLKTWL